MLSFHLTLMALIHLLTMLLQAASYSSPVAVRPLHLGIQKSMKNSKVNQDSLFVLYIL